MRKLALYAAMAAVTVAGAAPMTSQAAVKAYVINGNTGGGISLGNGNCIKNNGCSANDILQMITGGGSGCLGGGNVLIPGNGCPNVSGGLWNGSCPENGGNLGNSGCLGTEIPDILIPGWGTPGSQNPGCGNLGTQIPGWGNQGCEIPGCGDQGSQNPGSQNPDWGNQGCQNPGTQIPGGGSGTQNPGTQIPGGGSGDQNPGTQIPGGGSGTQTPEQPGQQDKTEIQQVIDLVNEERARAGLAPVTEDAGVSAAAAVRAREITQSFSHTRPDGRNFATALDEQGVTYWGNGENIAYGQRNAAEVMSGWMNSQGHRANILRSSYTKIGVGCYESSNGVKYWVQLFTY